MAEGTRRSRIATTELAVWILFGVACVLPAVKLREALAGFQVVGWGAVLCVYAVFGHQDHAGRNTWLSVVSWLANPALLVGSILLAFGLARAAFVVGLVALTMGFAFWIDRPFGILPGYFAWVASLLALIVGSAWVRGEPILIAVDAAKPPPDLEAE